MPNCDSDWRQVPEVNCAPRSVVTMEGTPKRETQWSRNAWRTVSAVVFASGTASGQRVVRSIIVNKYLNPRSGEKGPTMSTWTCVKRVSGTGIGRTWGLRVPRGFASQTSLALSGPPEGVATHTAPGVGPGNDGLSGPSGGMGEVVDGVEDGTAASLRNQHARPPERRVSHTTEVSTPGKRIDSRRSEEAGSSLIGR